MAKKTSKKRSKKKRTTVQDIEELLSAQPPKVSMITGTAGSSEACPAGDTLERHKIMSNENIRFVWSKESNVIHDKSCELARKISVKNLKTSETYDASRKQCPHCRITAYIRAGGGYSEKEEYLKFFDRINMDEELMRRLFILDDARTQIFDDMITVKLKSDTWKIRVLDDRNHHVELLFNNFEVKKGVRSIYDGFHRVKTGISAAEALEIMEGYEWKDHSNNITARKLLDRVVMSCRRLKKKVLKKRNVFKGLKNSLGGYATYYVDGDNKPQERIVGIESLSKNDRVKIFCADDASYFHDPRRREELLEACRCKVSFIPIKPGADAVDFAIGMDAYYKCMSEPGQRIYLLSGDKHFTVIKQQIDAMANKKNRVMHLNSIEQAYRKDERHRFKEAWDCWLA